jgi:hypothetical protein
MREQLISFETAKLAKELGFNWDVAYFFKFKGFKKDTIKEDKTLILCDHNQGVSISRPTQSLLQKWIRETYEIDVESRRLVMADGRKLYQCFVYKPPTVNLQKGRFSSYEEALEKGLQEALKLIKDESEKSKSS